MINLDNVTAPEEFEILVKNIPYYEVITTTTGGKVMTLLKMETIKLIKKEIFKCIAAWKLNLNLYNSALVLIEEIIDDYRALKEREDEYISSMKSNLRGIQANIARYNKEPTHKQLKAITNLKNGIAEYTINKKLDEKHLPSLFNQTNADHDLETFTRHFFGSQYSAAYYLDQTDHQKDFMKQVIKSFPRSDAFEDNFSQDPNF